MREALALALQDYAGALVLVSHDRSLLLRVVDEFWLVANGRVGAYRDDLDSYTSVQTRRIGSSKPRSSRKSARQAAAARRDKAKPYQKRVRDLEDRLEQQAAALRQAEAKLADPTVYQQLPAPELDALLAEAGRLRKSLETTEADWVAATEALEDLIAPP